MEVISIVPIFTILSSGIALPPPVVQALMTLFVMGT